jgi:hypothetical protein
MLLLMATGDRKGLEGLAAKAGEFFCGMNNIDVVLMQ